MSILSMTAIAVALAMDAFAVSIAAGIFLKQLDFRHYFRLAWHFCFFQAMMPVIGWSAGMTVRTWIEAYDHWVAFGLLVYVAQGMLLPAIRGKKEEEHPNNPTKGMTLVMLSIATSIDALAVGLTLSFLNVSIWIPAVVIGLTAGAFTIIGMRLGQIAANASRFSRWAEALGGGVLLLIGLNILREHGVMAFAF